MVNFIPPGYFCSSCNGFLDNNPVIFIVPDLARKHLGKNKKKLNYFFFLNIDLPLDGIGLMFPLKIWKRKKRGKGEKSGKRGKRGKIV